MIPRPAREPEAPPRPAAGGSPRLAAAARSAPRGRAAPQLGARGSPPRPLLPRSAAPRAGPFVGAERWRLGRKGGALDPSVAPPWDRARGRAPRGPLSRGGGRAGPVRGPALLQRPRAPSPPAPRRHQPSNFVLGDQPLSPPGSAPAPARPRRPPPAGLRERGARSHLTARPVNQRPPRAPSRPAAGLGLRAPAAPESGAGTDASHEHNPLYSDYPNMGVTPLPQANWVRRVIFFSCGDKFPFICSCAHSIHLGWPTVLIC